jgi:hypothetical protein
MKTTMKFFFCAVSLMIICSNLNAQNPIKKDRASSNSLMDGIFRSSKVAAHLPIGVQPKTTSPYFKVKQAETVKYQLDSLVAVENKAWAKIVCNYDSLGRLILFYVTNYNTTTKVWEFSYKNCYKYGDNYLIKNRYDYYSSKMHFERTKTEYDVSGRINCLKIGTDSVTFESTANPTYYLYDANNRLAAQQICNSTGTPSRKVQYFYDSNGRDTAAITYNINGSILTPYSKEVYSYDSIGNRINSKELSSFLGNWSVNYNYDFLYNTHHDCISDIESYYYGGTVDKSKYFSTYNTLTQNSDIYSGDTFTDNFPFSFQSQLNQMDLYQIDNKKDSLLGTYYFYYSPKVNTSLSNPAQTVHTKLRYNSLTKSLEISAQSELNSPQLNIYNMNGTLIMSCAVNRNSIEVDCLKNGVYIYKLIGTSDVSTGKFMVE